MDKLGGCVRGIGGILLEVGRREERKPRDGYEDEKGA